MWKSRKLYFKVHSENLKKKQIKLKTERKN